MIGRRRFAQVGNYRPHHAPGAGLPLPSCIAGEAYLLWRAQASGLQPPACPGIGARRGVKGFPPACSSSRAARGTLGEGGRPPLSSACLWSKMSESSSPVRLDLSSLRGAPQDVLHLLPCEVEHNGSAPVDRYFTPAIRQGLQEKSVSFRGRSLKGQEVMVPQGYVGLVLKEDQRPCTEEEERTVRLKSTFGALTVWNLERAPSADDGLLLALSWPGIAEAIHAPVLKKEQ
ncbi:ribonuclease H2 subunit C isoform X2 [Dermochelys coriacea]|uniref:ribonuclease H2 subunit C isoform X2 n=1 Tax=Dermochelys coriacea TaxID=27794 RepID=UPI0018E700E0|nr:ribonuclease H2 subunit C isoform X2 [Dermochelys coriacea]